MRVRAAALTIAALSLTALVGAGCSGTVTVDESSLPPVGTPAPNTPPGSVPDVSTLPAGALPPPSGDPSACAGGPFELTVRTDSGEQRTVAERSSWAMYVPGAASWIFVTSDQDLPAESVRTALPDPSGKTMVVMRLNTTRPTTETLLLSAGDTFQPSGASSTPTGQPVVDLQVRTTAGQAPATGALAGTLTVDAVTAEGVCLSADLHRADGAQVKGRISAPFLSVNPSVLTS